MTERDITLSDGRTYRTYDTGGDGLALLWHHGSPQTGALLAPLLAAARARGVRLVATRGRACPVGMDWLEAQGALKRSAPSSSPP